MRKAALICLCLASLMLSSEQASQGKRVTRGLKIFVFGANGGGGTNGKVNGRGGGAGGRGVWSGGRGGNGGGGRPFVKFQVNGQGNGLRGSVGGRDVFSNNAVLRHVHPGPRGIRFSGQARAAAQAALAAARHAKIAASRQEAKAEKLSRALARARSRAQAENRLLAQAEEALASSERTFDRAVYLANSFQQAWNQAQALVIQARQSQEAAEVVNELQVYMAKEAKDTVGALNLQQNAVLSELQSVKSAAAQAQSAANSALAKAKHISDY